MEKEYEIPKEYLGNKRQNFNSWDETFMLMAVTISGRSKDPSSQVGACIVDQDNYILSLGYNGAPNGWADENFPWGRDGEEINTKYPYVVHAEANAILNHPGDRKNFKGATAYVTLFPCSNCAKLLVQTGIKKIVYLSDKYKGTKDNEASKLLLRHSGVEYIQFNEELQREVIVSLVPNEGIKKLEKKMSK